jgi:hypothetical protein
MNSTIFCGIDVLEEVTSIFRVKEQTKQNTNKKGGGKTSG